MRHKIVMHCQKKEGYAYVRDVKVMCRKADSDESVSIANPEDLHKLDIEFKYKDLGINLCDI